MLRNTPTLLWSALAILATLGIPGGSAGQSCDERRLEAPADSLPYQPRGERCEGFYRREVSSPDLSLVGLMRGRLHFEPAADERVTLYAAVEAPEAIRVRVQPLPIKTYYQMDALLEVGDSFRWPMDVVHEAELLPSQLGVAAWFEADGTRIYVPVEATPEIARPIDDPAIRILFRCNVTIHYFQYSWQAGDQTYESEATPRVVPPGRPLVVTLPSDLRGLVHVAVGGRIRGSNDRWVSDAVAVYLGDA